MSPPHPDAGLRLTARAKLNLYLHIVGRRADGFHLIESLIGFADVGDVLTLSPEPHATRLTLEGPFAPELGGTDPKDNLVLRAAGLLADWARAQGESLKGAALALEKNLPVASGIGGGSADAAAALRGLVRLWDLSIGNSALAEIAGRLGADVPACLEGRAALMEGIGERVTPLADLPAVPLLLVNPRIPLATPAVYRIFREQHAIATAARPKPAGPFGDMGALIAALKQTQNDLEPPAIALCPEIGRVLTALKESGAALARMSGSGASCFGLFTDRAKAAAAHKNLQAMAPHWWVAESAIQ
jgi:4-diphosphocytidyl-2-C-methyl-D-erythritol kinase